MGSSTDLITSFGPLGFLTSLVTEFRVVVLPHSEGCLLWKYDVKIVIKVIGILKHHMKIKCLVLLLIGHIANSIPFVGFEFIPHLVLKPMLLHLFKCQRRFAILL